ncbi:CU044_2847 family protein [Calothrix sp. UHCC 0171]|uniref:CU044_2847 family protein n=1 Tax=Calothrix sp. UHCC 0171 TaxID=3110245 RepID=UPI002B21A32F|nr:CU044_2847 family protein [Calothrix sp. UHCC 0171]MEA5570682.1 CU044_2847 family protein [Calothrix sp. UHCC 0171]
MTQLTPIQIDENTIIYIEASEDVNISPVATEEEEEEALDEKGMSPEAVRKQMVQNFQAIQGTIRAYTVYSLNAFKQMPVSNANVDKVTLEFGIELGGEAGVPYVTKGTAKSNMKITVECSFPKEKENK